MHLQLPPLIAAYFNFKIELVIEFFFVNIYSHNFEISTYQVGRSMMVEDSVLLYLICKIYDLKLNEVAYEFQNTILCDDLYMHK